MSRRTLLNGFCVALVGFTTCVSAQIDRYAAAPKIVDAANSWRAGDPIPVQLRQYHKSPSDLPDPADSEVLIHQVNNLALLSALATDLGADQACREEAFIQGTYAGGPSKFFSLLSGELSARKQESNPWLLELRQRIALPHVVVNALFIQDADMPRESALQVLTRIRQELRDGTSWDAVYLKYSEQFGYRTSHRTKVGNLGHLVIYPDPALGRGYFITIGPHTITWEGEELPRRLSRLSFFDASHLPAIMRMSPGEVLYLHSSLYDEWVLYQAEEVYGGIKDASCPTPAGCA